MNTYRVTDRQEALAVDDASLVRLQSGRGDLGRRLLVLLRVLLQMGRGHLDLVSHLLLVGSTGPLLVMLLVRVVLVRLLGEAGDALRARHGSVRHHDLGGEGGRRLDGCVGALLGGARHN